MAEEKISFPKVSWIGGDVDMQSMELISIPSHKYQEVELAINLDGSMNVGCVKISGEIPYEQAKAFGKELELRWNAGQEGITKYLQEPNEISDVDGILIGDVRGRLQQILKGE